VIYKPVSSSTLNLRRYKYEQPISFLRAYTTLLENYSRSDFDDVSHSPCIFQRYIDKRFELRITVVADQLFAAKIDSQANEEAKHDWRRAIHSGEYSPYELPNEIAEKCLRLVKEFGLQFGAIDMIVTPADEYVFLEVNPNGQYGWIETRTGLRISEAIARALVRGDNQVQSARSSAQTTPVKLSSS
jgi:glutathione synthase/RimK-type ligase-like ATP-grasp enzyme